MTTKEVLDHPMFPMAIAYYGGFIVGAFVVHPAMLVIPVVATVIVGFFLGACHKAEKQAKHENGWLGGMRS